MKWKARLPPEDGELLRLRKFALWPTRINDEWVWLESYFETCRCNYFDDAGPGEATDWKYEWVTVTRTSEQTHARHPHPDERSASSSKSENDPEHTE